MRGSEFRESDFNRGLRRACSALLLLLTACLVVAAPARAAGEYELNDSRETAYGPLAGATFYTAGIETLNDVDWFVFYIKAYSQIEISGSTATKASPGSSFRLYDRDGEPIGVCCGDSNFHVSSNDVIERYSRTMAPGRYYIKVEGSQGARYKFRIDPPTSLTTSRECGEAIVAKDLIAPQLAEANEELAANLEALAAKATAVHASRRDVRLASKKAKRLRAKVKRLKGKAKRQPRNASQRRKLRRARARLRVVRSDVRGAVDRLGGAKEERRPVWQERVRLESVVGQHQQTIAGADAQIATYC